MPEQLDWRFCIRCNSLFWSGDPHGDRGVCPVDGAPHVPEGFVFSIPHDVPPSVVAQTDWRFCIRCKAMFWDGDPHRKGACAAGGAHQSQGWVFVLPHDVPGPGQPEWRFCEKCMSLFWNGNPAVKGVCPADRSAHVAQGFVFVLPHIGPPALDPVIAWVDSLRCHSETPGFGIGEGDEPFVIMASIDLGPAGAAGIPRTEVTLNGPLDDVDDQENHAFPVLPFWDGRPLDPDRVIFLAAALEHDNVNPDLARSAAAVAVQAAATATVGAPRQRIIDESVSALAAAVEPARAPALNRLIGRPSEVYFSKADVAAALWSGPVKKSNRYSSYGDYTIFFGLRRA